jgi:hypothetical protein
MKAFLGVAALALNIIGYIPYVIGIIRKKVKPHPVTWGIWTILTTIAAVNQVSNQGGYSSLFFISTTVLVFTVFILSLRYGSKGVTLIDKICLTLALALLVYWLTLQETRISTLIAVIIDAIGAIPTVIKTWRHPATETYIQWMLAGIGGFLTIFTVPRLDWALLIYPFYVVVMNATVVGVKYFRRRY